MNSVSKKKDLLGKKIKNLKNVLGSLEKCIADVKKKINSNEFNITEYKKEINDNEDSIKSEKESGVKTQAEIEALNKKIEKNKELLRKIEAELFEKKKEFTKNEKELNELKEKKAKIEKQIETYQKEIDQLDTKIGKYEKDVADDEDRIQTLEDENAAPMGKTSFFQGPTLQSYRQLIFKALEQEKVNKLALLSANVGVACSGTEKLAEVLKTKGMETKVECFNPSDLDFRFVIQKYQDQGTPPQGRKDGISLQWQGPHRMGAFRRRQVVCR